VLTAGRHHDLLRRRDQPATSEESGPGNAVLGAYLDQIGLPEDAIVYITQASPSSMKWLSMEEAAQHGIDVELLPSFSFVECRVTDNGSCEANTTPGHGLKIVEALARSLGGTIDQRFGSGGATAVLIFPAEVDTTERLA